MTGSERYVLPDPQSGPDEASWSFFQSNTCQCTQCRKMSGSLIFHYHTAKNTEITWRSQATCAEYNSSPGCFRAFCKECGSSIAWIDRRIGAKASSKQDPLTGNF
ncbi:hypothetical protein DFH07DRAFT_795455 [Mycena maculata]|uniref:CENP-V/GFA domain-containing protein n=1 Tax=Mycena maculata TaxID=230809 RepID=A0AAD7K7Z7_9AGAR|nr:hypothetical protein DFH07DRAFT_795455 [Mycena maculata]